MDWMVSRERLGAELIGARERVAVRWRLALREHQLLPVSLARCAPELVLRAGAALADGMPAATPWRRCGGLLLLDPRDSGALAAELPLLWRSMAAITLQLSFSEEEDRLTREQLGRQLDAALRGAAAELSWAVSQEEPPPALRFGGVRAVCRTGAADDPAVVRAA
jgi:hypothetical protein